MQRVEQRRRGGNRDAGAAGVGILGGEFFEKDDVLGRPDGREVEAFGVGGDGGDEVGAGEIGDTDGEEADFHGELLLELTGGERLDGVRRLVGI